MMGAREFVYLAWLRARGSAVPRHYREYLRADARARWPQTVQERLSALLRHCRERVPYYGALLRDERDLERDPEGALKRLPVLTKAIIRERGAALHSTDLARRRWAYNTSGGSTGEPVRLVQDDDYAYRTNALTVAFSAWLGHRPGEPEVLLWGSERDVLDGSVGFRALLRNRILRTSFLNAFRLTEEAMRGFATTLRRERPRFVVAYAQALYEFARFLEANCLEVPPPRAIVTSAGTLHPFMRAQIQKVFGCPVFDRYGSREVGLIGCERPGYQGLWIPPVSVYVEVVDERGQPVPHGADGELLVTSLANLAMPLVRYRIGDRGALLAGAQNSGQALARVLGRNVDAFRCRDGTLVDGEYFTHLLYFRDWVERFQFVQKGYDDVLLRVVRREAGPAAPAGELGQIEAQVRAALGPSARLSVEWVEEIAPAPSGKYRFTISELPPP